VQEVPEIQEVQEVQVVCPMCRDSALVVGKQHFTSNVKMLYPPFCQLV
jgi:hypothetical protein